MAPATDLHITADPNGLRGSRSCRRAARQLSTHDRSGLARRASTGAVLSPMSDAHARARPSQPAADSGSPGYMTTRRARLRDTVLLGPRSSHRTRRHAASSIRWRRPDERAIRSRRHPGGVPPSGAARRESRVETLSSTDTSSAGGPLHSLGVRATSARRQRSCRHRFFGRTRHAARWRARVLRQYKGAPPQSDRLKCYPLGREMSNRRSTSGRARLEGLASRIRSIGDPVQGSLESVLLAECSRRSAGSVRYRSAARRPTVSTGAHDPRLPPRTRRGGAAHEGARARLGARHESGDGHDGRLQDGDDPLERAGRDRPRGAARSARPGRRGTDDHEPEHARDLRGPDRPGRGGRSRGRSHRLHGRL